MTTSGTQETDAYSGRGSGAAVAAAVIGLVPAIFLGSLRFFLIDEPRVDEQTAGNLAFGLMLIAPYLLIYMASRVRRPGARGALLAVFGLIPLVVSFSTLSVVSLVLLPAAFATWFAAARSFTASFRPWESTGFAAAAGTLIVILLGLSSLTLLGLGDPEPRCWVLTLGAEGEYVWESRPNVGGPGELSAGPLNGHDRESSCVSDIITNGEAGVGVGLLATTFLVMFLTMKLPWIHPSGSGNS